MSAYRNIKILTWFNFFLDFRLYAPIAIIYFAKVTGSYTLGGAIFSVTMLSQALLEVPTGIYSDFIGRRKTVILGAMFSTLAVVFYALGGSFAVLVAGALLEGLSRALFSGNNDALLHNTLTDEGRPDEFHHFLGRVSAMFQVGLGISAILGSLIATFSFSLMMWLSVIPQLLGFLLSFKLVEPKTREKSSNVYAHLREALNYFIKNKKLRYLSLSSILGYATGESSYYFQAAFFNTLWPLWAVGIAKAWTNVGGAVSFYWAGKVINKLKSLEALIIGNLVNRILNLSALVFPTIFSPILMTSNSFTFGIMTVARGDLLQKEYTEEQRATMDSLTSLGESIGFAIFSFLIGFMADRTGPAKALIAVNLIQFSALYLYRKIKKA